MRLSMNGFFRADNDGKGVEKTCLFQYKFNFFAQGSRSNRQRIEKSGFFDKSRGIGK